MASVIFSWVILETKKLLSESEIHPNATVYNMEVMGAGSKSSGNEEVYSVIWNLVNSVRMSSCVVATTSPAVRISGITGRDLSCCTSDASNLLFLSPYSKCSCLLD